MKYVLYIWDEAEMDILEASLWYGLRRENYDKVFLKVVSDCVDTIRKNPYLFQEAEAGIRRCVMKKFPYGIFFTVEGNEITIFGCFNLERHTQTWKNRIELKE